jgi:hypothetical protein
MKHLIFFLAIIMLVPLEGQQTEVFEKSEVERTEYFSQSNRLCAQEKRFKEDESKKISFLCVLSRGFWRTSDAPIQFIRKIYLFQESLLI